MPEEVKPEALAPAMPAPIAEVLNKQAPQSARVTRMASFTPANLTEAVALARLMAKSDLMPREYKGKPENVLIGMQYCAELGIPPMLGLQNISIINGHACLWGDLFLAVIQSSPHYEYHREYFEGQDDSFAAVCVMKRKGQDAHTVKFSVADAKKARLWGKDGTWQTNPKRMLQMRARGFSGRDKFADALKGMIIAEEAMDMPIDTSEAKRVRESATLDMGGVDALIPSSEPNRGHDHTGLERTIENDAQSQATPKEQNSFCNDCGVMNGHDASCKHYVKKPTPQDEKTSKGTIKASYLVLTVESKKKKKNSEPYLVLNVVNSDNVSGKLYVWHKTMHKYFAGQSDLPLVCEVAEQKGEGKTYFTLEHILELKGQKFVNDEPAQEGTMPADREPGAYDEFDFEPSEEK
jgi:hypothetical protein